MMFPRFPQPRDLQETFNGTVASSPIVASASLMPSLPSSRLAAIRAQAAAYPDGDLAYVLARVDMLTAAARAYLAADGGPQSELGRLAAALEAPLPPEAP